MIFIGAEKVVILTGWLVWLVLVILFALVVEFIGDRLEHEVSLSSYSEQELQEIYGARILGSSKKRGDK